MDSKYNHLGLTFIPDSFVRRIPPFKGGGYKKPDRTNKEAVDTILQSFNDLRKSYDEKKKNYLSYLNPHLIFKIETNQEVHEDTFKADLNRAGIKIISPSSDKSGFWIAFSDDNELIEFKKRLTSHVVEDKYKFIYSINSFQEIKPEEKEGSILKNDPIGENEICYLNVELWRMEDATLNSFILELSTFINDNGGELTDYITTNSFCLLRIKVNKSLYEKLLQMPEVKQIDRIPRVKIQKILSKDIDELFIDSSPSDSSCGILVIDSGILSNHPLLEKCVGAEIVAKANDSSELSDDFISDEIGHGTEVAGIALYGDIKRCIIEEKFTSDIWLFSAKVMFEDEDGYATFNEKELVEHQLDYSVREIVSTYPNCRVINLSFGNEAYAMFGNRHQFNLASLLDELSKELNVIFVVSAGNYDYAAENISENYPNYLLDEDTGKAKIIDPATSALAITVGSLYKEYIGLDLFCKTDFFNDGYHYDYPSPRTRVGPGYQGMIKPDLVEYGGGSYGEESDVVTLNYKWIEEGRLFSLGFGTSLSAPKVAHLLASLMNKYPSYSSNLIKALLISSARIPPSSERPTLLSTIDFYSTDQNSMNLLKIYGFGKPSLEKSLFSEPNRVLLIRENSIKLNNFHIYEIYLPDDFSTNNGEKRIDVTFVYNPPVNKNRIDYLGCICETHLFKNMSVEEIRSLYEKLDIDNVEDEIIPDREDVKAHEIKLFPGVNLRKKGVHQRGSKVFKRQNKIDTDSPLLLVVVCKDRWIKDNEYEQDYSVVVTIEYENQINIYEQIRIKNTSRVRLKQNR